MDRPVQDASSTTIPVIARLDVNDFHRRWQAARVAALQQFCGGASDEPTANELAMLQQIPPTQSANVLKAVYDNARKLGHSALRYFALLWDILDVRDVLSGAGVPCMQGQWSSDGQHTVVERRGCSVPQQCGTLGCDYWNEAIDGLLMGLGDEVRHMRHRSAGHGDDFCRDAFAPRAQDGAAYGPLPEHLVPFFANLEQRFASETFRVTFVGYAAGVVYYEATARGAGCGGQIWHTMLQAIVARTYPTFRMQDVSPASILGREENATG